MNVPCGILIKEPPAPLKRDGPRNLEDCSKLHFAAMFKFSKKMTKVDSKIDDIHNSLSVRYKTLWFKTLLRSGILKAFDDGLAATGKPAK